MYPLLYAVTSFRQYEDGESHFDFDGLFASEEQANDYIIADMKETLEENPSLSPYADYDDFDIIGESHCFKWNKSPVELPAEIFASLGHTKFSVGQKCVLNCNLTAVKSETLGNNAPVPAVISALDAHNGQLCVVREIHPNQILSGLNGSETYTVSFEDGYSFEVTKEHLISQEDCYLDPQSNLYLQKPEQPVKRYVPVDDLLDLLEKSINSDMYFEIRKILFNLLSEQSK